MLEAANVTISKASRTMASTRLDARGDDAASEHLLNKGTPPGCSGARQFQCPAWHQAYGPIRSSRSA